MSLVSTRQQSLENICLRFSSFCRTDCCNIRYAYQMLDATAGNIAALMALGMALAFVIVDFRSPTSRWLALFLASLAASIATSVNFIRVNPALFEMQGQATPWWLGLPAVASALAVVTSAQWLHHVRRTIPAGNLNTTMGDYSLRVAQVLAVVYAGLAMYEPSWLAQYFLGALMQPEHMLNWRFLVMAVPFGLALFLVIDSALVTLRRKPDVAEKIRLIGICLATPFLVSGLVLPFEIAPYGVSVGLIIVLISAVQYYILQGQRGQFMTRFLSPQVANMVRRSGLQDALSEQTTDLSVVACDLRGFTQYAAEHDSPHVIGFLQQYYDYVGQIAKEFDATIKDYAGDGVLLLVGAPVAQPNHAEQAVAMACAIRDRRALFLPNDLGLGVGVASGVVSVGVIGGERLEYAAVGAAVNLAARLCDHAANGEVRVAADTAKQVHAKASDYQVEPAEPANLKGLLDPVENYLAALAVT